MGSTTASLRTCNTVLANTPHGETREARAARLAGDNKKKQRAWSRADALAHERVSAAAEWPDEVDVDEGAIVTSSTVVRVRP